MLTYEEWVEEVTRFCDRGPLALLLGYKNYCVDYAAEERFFQALFG